LIGIQSWIIFSDLSKECKSADSFESLFSCNKIEFRKADDYSLVQSNGYSVSDADDEDLTRSGNKSRKKNRKRKKPRYESDEDRLDQLIEVPNSSTMDIIRSCRSWCLSTDAFSASWDIVCFICLALFPFIEVSDLHI
jgi:hypothetical protein